MKVQENAMEQYYYPFVKKLFECQKYVDDCCQFDWIKATDMPTITADSHANIDNLSSVYLQHTQQ